MCAVAECCGCLHFYSGRGPERRKYQEDSDRRQPHYGVPRGRSCFQASMNFTAEETKRSVSSRPRAAVAVFGSSALQDPVLDISRVEVCFPVDFAFRVSAKKTRLAVGSPATTLGTIPWRCGG